MKTHFPTLPATLSMLVLVFRTATAAPIVSDSFGTAGDPSSGLNGRTADSGQTWIANSDWTTFNGNAEYDGTNGNGMAGITLGANYFDNNPGIYQLDATVTITTTTAAWIAIGFSDAVGTASGNGFFQNSSFAGEPWMLLRGDGGALVRSASGSGSDLVSASDGTFNTTNSTLRFVYDTSLPSWTIDAYIDGTQLDLNGASAGNTFTYGTNPIGIGSVALTGNTNVTGMVHDFSLTMIPEPSSLLLVAAALGALCLFQRRRG